jgi:hypothetical protein
MKENHKTTLHSIAIAACLILIIHAAEFPQFQYFCESITRPQGLSALMNPPVEDEWNNWIVQIVLIGYIASLSVFFVVLTVLAYGGLYLYKRIKQKMQTK